MAKKSKAEIAIEEGKEVILEYLRNQNRPFNEKMLFENLHGAVTKPDVGRVLTVLVEEGKVSEKLHGKAKVYWYNQALLPDVSVERIQELDAEIAAFRPAYEELKAELASLRSQQAALQAELTEAEIEEQITALTAKTKADGAKLEHLRANAETVSRDDFASAHSALVASVAEWTKRRKIFRNMIGQIMEQSGKKEKELAKMIGFETDAEAGVSLDEFRAKVAPPKATRQRPGSRKRPRPAMVAEA